MQVARDRQKSSADLKRKPMEFQVGDRVMLKVSPWKGVVRFGKRGKLNPRYIRPFKVLEKVGAVAYKLELPQELSRVHNTFHVSNLKKCYADEPLTVPLDGLHFDDKLQFVNEPIEIMDREVKRLRQKHVPIVKVQWNSIRGPEFTWEHEDQFRKKYPHLFTKIAPSDDESLSEEEIQKDEFKYFSNPLYDLDDEIITNEKILPNQKDLDVIDSIFDEFSLPRPPEESNSEISDATIESLWKRIFNQKEQKESQKANKSKHGMERTKSKVIEMKKIQL
ncbi:hypothetical protein Tco_0150588 [Tanacetum coccineum]